MQLRKSFSTARAKVIKRLLSVKQHRVVLDETAKLKNLLSSELSLFSQLHWKLVSHISIKNCRYISTNMINLLIRISLYNLSIHKSKDQRHKSLFTTLGLSDCVSSDCILTHVANQKRAGTFLLFAVLINMKRSN